jgi:hypothetical protein
LRGFLEEQVLGAWSSDDAGETLTMSSLVAAANSFRGTSSVIRACRVGESMALPARTAR